MTILQKHFSIFLLAVLALSQSARAEIGVVAYDAVDSTSYGPNTGRTGVYLSDVCMADEPNKVRPCTDADSHRGVVVQRVGHMTNGNEPQKDWIALPANISFYGKAGGRGDAPLISTPAVRANVQKEVYEQNHLKPVLDPNGTSALPPGNWKGTVASTENRSLHVISIPSSALENERVVAFLNGSQNVSHFSELSRNCANFANDLVRVAKGAAVTHDANGEVHVGKISHFEARGFEDAFLMTPLADAKAVRKLANKTGVPYTVTNYVQTAGTFRPSTSPSEMTQFSNSHEFLDLPLRWAPGYSEANMALKAYRRLGGELPGFRPYFDLTGKESKNHGTSELAQDSAELAQMKKDRAPSSEITNVKSDLHAQQNQVFGTRACWKNQEKKMDRLVAQATDRGLINASEQKLFKIHDLKNMILRSIPFLHLDPSQRQLMLTATSGTQASNDGELLTKDGVTAGNTRNTVDQHDPRLGFVLMAATVDYELAAPASRRLTASDFDADWKQMVSLGRKAGLTLDASNDEAVAACSGAKKTPAAVVAEVPSENSPPATASAAETNE